jgi:hypothetical protein
MQLKPVRGRNQSGICFASSEDKEVNSGVYRLICNTETWLADVRTNSQITPGMIVLDSRIFDALKAQDTSDISLESYSTEVMTLEEIVAKVESTKGLDSVKVADAISRRAGDLREDLDGLILRDNDDLTISRLGIHFTISRLQPKSPGRVEWNHLSTIRLEAPAKIQPCNILAMLEVGASAHIQDAENSRRRVEVFIDTLREFATRFDQYATGGLFSGLVFSEEVIQFTAFDSDTGERRESVKLDSKSIIEAYLDWIEEMLPEHSREPSDLGDAISDSVEIAQKMTASNGLPTAIILLSSGVFSAGPNPVKSAKRGLGLDKIGFIILTAGEGVELDILSAVGNLYNQQPIKIDNTVSIDSFLDSLGTWTTKVTH